MPFRAPVLRHDRRPAPRRPPAAAEATTTLLGKALQFCMIGRPLLWGLAAGGEPGVRRALDIFADELDVAMALAGLRDLADITPDFVRPERFEGA